MAKQNRLKLKHKAKLKRRWKRQGKLPRGKVVSNEKRLRKGVMFKFEDCSENEKDYTYPEDDSPEAVTMCKERVASGEPCYCKDYCHCRDCKPYGFGTKQECVEEEGWCPMGCRVCDIAQKCYD